MASTRILILELVTLGVLLSVMLAEGDASSQALPAQAQSTTTTPPEPTPPIKYDFKVSMKLHYYCIRVCRVLIKETRQECLKRKETSCSALKGYSYKEFFAHQFTRIGLGKVASIVLRVPKGNTDTTAQVGTVAVTETAATSSKSMKDLPIAAKPASKIANEGATGPLLAASEDHPVGGIQKEVAKLAAPEKSAGAASEVADTVGVGKKDDTATHGPATADVAGARGAASEAKAEPLKRPPLQRSTSLSS